MNLAITWVTSDTHFGHANVIKYSKRPFKDVDEMDEILIKNWNTVVQPQHMIFHLGDFSFKDPKRYLNRLNGKIIYLPGNHDQMFYKDRSLLDRFENAAMLREVTKRIDGVKFNLTAELQYDSANKSSAGMIFMGHYSNLVWNKSHRGALHIHGHSHGNLRYPAAMRALDAGVDPQGYYPISLADVVHRLEKIAPPTFDHHGEA